MILAREMNDLRTVLWDLYGQQNEIRIGVKPKPEDRIEKPEALVRYEQAKDLGVPYVAGGLLDQPYIWVQEHGVIVQFLYEWDVVEKSQLVAAQQQSQLQK